jgi:hypothetical protein
MTAPTGPDEPRDTPPTGPAPEDVARGRTPETAPSTDPIADAADPTTDGSARPPVLLQVRPRRITILAVVSAIVVVAAMIVVSVLLLQSEEGVSFRVSDQIGIIGIGLVLAGLILTAARPRLRVDPTGVRVRNVLAEQFVPWSLILRIGYPQGSPWAQLVMPDDEVKPVMAIQAMDRARAVQALERVRALQAQYGPPPPRPQSPGPRPEDDLARPLGRLEIIDREKAAARDRDAAAKRARDGARGKGSA